MDNNLGASFKRNYSRRLERLRTLKANRLVPQNRRYSFSIKDVKAGGFLKFEGMTYKVESISVYRETDEDFVKELDYVFYELKLFCLETGEIFNMEWEEDDEVEASLTIKKLRFTDLSDDAGESIDEDDLDQISEDEDSVFFNGTEFYYDDDYACFYYRDGGDKKDKVYFYEFVADDETSVCIEEWISNNKESYEIYYSRKINPDEIEVLALS